MRKSLFVFLLLIGTGGVMGMTPDSRALKIDSLMNAYSGNGLFDGVVLVSEKGRILYQEAFGIVDREWDVPMTIDAKFKIGSISKTMTALLVLQLVQEGLLRLDGTVRDYIPDCSIRQGERITIHHLLTHTSGILNSLNPEEEAVRERQVHDLRGLIRYAENTELVADPGSGFHYINFGYNILAYIAEKAAGKPFEALLRERIFGPAGMRNTSQYLNKRIEPRLARGYEYRLLTGFENASYFDNSFAVGCGGIVSTAEDLYRFHLALMTTRLISKDLRGKMFHPAGQGSYGYGWGITSKASGRTGDTLRIAEHAGSVNGFGSYIAWILNDNSLVVVLKNSRDDASIGAAYAPDIGRGIISVLNGESVPIPKKSIARHIAVYLGRDGFDQAKEEYDRVKKRDADRYSFEEDELNRLGVELLFRFKMPDEALQVFRLNMEEFPDSYNTYDSNAYVLMQKNDLQSAIRFYRKGLSVLKAHPEQNRSPQVLKDAEKALEYIKEMEGKLRQPAAAH